MTLDLILGAILGFAGVVACERKFRFLQKGKWLWKR